MLSPDPKSIGDHIDTLARLTGAPETFVVQVKALFSTKGISLREDAAPYLHALEEAFRREESIRETARRAREQVTRLRAGFDRVGQAYVRKHATMSAAGRRSAEVPIPGDHRAYVTRTAREDWPMVPGPEDVQ